MKATRDSFVMKSLVLGVMACCAGSALAGTEGTSSTFYGADAGFNADPSSGENTFFGRGAGGTTTTGTGNTFMGLFAGGAVVVGIDNTSIGLFAGFGSEVGDRNTALGAFARYGATEGVNNTALGASAGSGSGGNGNVFLGYGAGFLDSRSDQLVIDNCWEGGACNRPLINGDFKLRTLELNGVLGVTADRHSALVKSQLHFSVNGDDVGGWLTSAGENNFFTSSGARYDADAGGWIQRSADGRAVIAGSGAAGFRVLTSTDGAIGSAVVPISRLHINYDGLMGVNSAPVAGRAINTSTGAYLSSGGVWTNASSRALKDGIERLSAEEAQQAFARLEPVRFRYKDENAAHVGFIAEDVPDLVATADRKGLSPMDVVAVLTKVVQEKSRVIDRQEAQIAAQAARFASMEARFEALAAEVRSKRR